jgi:pyruvate,orthophosphate dikinase
VVHEDREQFTTGTVTVRAGDWLSLDGTTGTVRRGRARLVAPELSDDLLEVLGWADDVRRLRVRANADQPAEAEKARAFGAEGIGLCRTEHMFFEGGRIETVREMILADTERERRRALDALLPLQRDDFRALFETMDGYPVTVRLLDPPLHEFLPADADGLEALAARLEVPVEAVRRRVAALQEQNPMLGHRGCRLGVTHPEITAMQARALFEAAVEAAEAGVDVRPEVMVPLVGTVAELRHQRAILDETAAAVFAERGRAVPYLVGTMIEVPRAALVAGAIAEEAAFFSFGTNDLTQMTFGYSRDDAGTTFLPAYLELKMLPDDPFQTLDQDGVGTLIRDAAARGRAVDPALHLGVCGEHGGDAESVAFFHAVGLDYVSCSPFRVPVARLAAAQAALRDAA